MSWKITPYKKCKDCGDVLPREEFPISYINKKTGIPIVKARCKKCEAQYWTRWRVLNKDKVKKYNNSPSAKNKRWEYYLSHKEEARQYQIEHWEEIKRWNRAYGKTDKMREYGRMYKKRKRETDVNFRISANIKSRLKQVFKGQRKYERWMLACIGCSFNDLKVWLESQWKEGMSWSNYALRGWHIDHIKPLASFDLTDDSQLRQAWHYTNLQPLWWFDNLSKGAKIA
jgi:hypothetical protein